MWPSFARSRITVKSAVALLLTFTAGIVDIVGYISLYHIFVAHMTGVTVHLGNKLAVGDGADAMKYAAVLIGFVSASVLGRVTIEAGARTHRRTVATITLISESILILLFMWASHSTLLAIPQGSVPLRTICSLLALLAAAMGLQTATLTRIGPLTIHTTFVTGMLNKFAQSFSQRIFWLHDNWRRHTLANAFHSSARHPALRNAQLMLTIWFAYMIGSVAGTWMNSKWSVGALFVPVFLLLVSVAIDQFRPLSLEEEQDQV